MQFSNYWQRFEHTGKVEDYLNYLYNTDREYTTDVSKECCPENCRAEGRVYPAAGEDGSCRNPCM